MKLIGICGWIGSGKDTIADYLVNFHGFRRESYAGTLKDAVSAVFGWDRELLEGRTKKAREWREQPDLWWEERLGRPVTPRSVLQYWGTEVCRRGYDDEIWIASLENKLRTCQDDVVISDCRFPNEIKSIRRSGGRIYWVQRGSLPSWHDLALRAAHDQYDVDAHDALSRLGVHASEWAWMGTDFDGVIDNNGSIEDLYDRVRSLV